MKKLLLFVAVSFLVSTSAKAVNISVIVFSYSVGWFGSQSSNGISSGYTFSNYGVKNGYFKNTNDQGAISNNIYATCVFEMSDGSTIEIAGEIYARETNGNTVRGVFWRPLSTSGTVSVGGYSLSSASGGVCVQFIGQSISAPGAQGSISISGNSGNLSIQDLVDYAASYPNVVTNTTPTSFSNSSVTWGGYLPSAASAFTFSSAGIAYSPQTYTNGVANPVTVDPSSTSQVKTVMVSTSSTTSANIQYNFSGTTSGLTGNTKYYYRAYVVEGGQTYQGPQESFTTCADAPVGTGATICSGSTASISATGAGTLSWYAAASGGTALGTGTSYTSAALTNSTSSNSTVTYYVEASGSSCASTRTAVAVTVKPVTSSVEVCHSAATCAVGSSITLSANGVQSGSGSYAWYSNTVDSNQGGTAVGNTTSSQNIPLNTVAGIYYYYYTLNDGCGTYTSPTRQVVVYNNLWDGSSSTSWTDGANWSTGSAPSTTISNILVIPSASVSTFPTIADITISSGGAIVLMADANFTLTGTMTNNGKFIVNSGATFVYSGTTPFASGTTGEFVFKQDVTGKSALFSGTYQPVGRYWYMGVPFSQARSVFGTAPSAVEANGPYSSKVWGWNEAGGAVWSEITSQSATLNPTEGYLVRTGGSCKNLQFTTTSAPYTADISKSVTRTTGGNSLDGYNLISNPFPAYIDAVAMKNASVNIGNTVWYRTYNSTNNQMVFDHLQANAPSSSIVNSNNGHSTTQLQKIPPYQAFWVRVQGSPGSSGTVNINRTMLSHEPNGMNLKTTSEFKAFVRMNLAQGVKTDQFVVYLEDEFTNGYDGYDGEKMFVAGMPQVYTKTGSYKLAIQSVKADKSKTTIPVSVEIPTPTMYTFAFIDHHVQSGKVFLEDKKYGIYVDLDIDTAYTFFSTSGTLHDRFALHFMRKVIGAADPTIVDDWAHAELGQDEDLAIKSLANEAVLVSRPVEHEGTAVVTVFDLSGKQVYSSQMESTTQQFDLHVLHGIYLIQVVSNGQLFSQKVLLN
jgi:Ig-like domain CHU_C associated